MRLFNSKTLVLSCVVFLSLPACVSREKASVSDVRDPKILTILSDFAPPTLNPRFTTEAAGQRIGMLLFSALTKLDADLKPVPDLAASWKTDPSGLRWTFKIRNDAKDWDGNPITASDLASCFEKFLFTSPTSPLKGSFTNWKSTHSNGETVTIELTKPDPYFDRNLVLLKFFRVRGETAPCVQPKENQEIIGSGVYRGDPFIMNPESSLVLAPTTQGDAPKLNFIFMKDETSRTLKLLEGKIDLAQNVLSQTKTEWVLKKNPDYKILERDGVNVNYLAFNLKNPYLADVRVRRAISQAIDRELIIREKLKEFVSRAGSFLSPHLPDSHQTELAYDPHVSEKILNEAGYPRKGDGFRFTLNYKTTPAREGIEMAQILKSMLGKIGIRVHLDIVDLAVFLHSTKRGFFDLYNSRWIGVADGSIFYRTLHSKSSDNRVSYRNAEMDAWIDQAAVQPGPERKKLLTQIQKKMAEDLPYFPLWFWTNALLMRKDLVGLESSDLSLSGGFQHFAKVRRSEKR